MRTLLLSIILALFSIGSTYSQDNAIALIGATIIDVSDSGNHPNDLNNSSSIDRLMITV